MSSSLTVPTSGVTVNGAPPVRAWTQQVITHPSSPAVNGINISSPSFPHSHQHHGHQHSLKTPKPGQTPVPKAVSVPSRDRDFSDLGFPLWNAIYEGLTHKILDEKQYGNYAGTDSTADGSGILNAQASADIFHSCVGGHMLAFKAFLTDSVRATPSQLPTHLVSPSSPNPSVVHSPFQPLSQHILMQALSQFLQRSLLNHQMQQLVAQMSGQVHFILGRILRGAGFPVETAVLGRQVSGMGCGIRLMDSMFQARVFVFRAAMKAQAAAFRARSQPAPTPIFYLSPSFAHSIGFTDALPRFAWELNVPESAFKILPLAPSMDETMLYAAAALTETEVPGSEDARKEQAPVENHVDAPNAFLNYQLDSQSLESEIASDIAAATQTGSHPCAVFVIQGNAAGLDLPYEFDNVDEIATVASKYALSVHAEGHSIFWPAALRNSSSNSSSSSASTSPAPLLSSTLFESVDSFIAAPYEWFGLSHGPALVALRDPRLLRAPLAARGANGVFNVLEGSPSLISLSSCCIDEFPSLFALWFNMLQLSSTAYPILLERISIKQMDKIGSLRRMVSAQKHLTFVGPAGEGDEERASYVQELATARLSHWMQPNPSHGHMFFYVSLPKPWVPEAFNMSIMDFNNFLSNRLIARLTSKWQCDVNVWQRIFGLHLFPVQHFERIGFLFQPSPVTVWTTDAQIAEETSAFANFLVQGIEDEIKLVEMNGRLREEFAELIAAEGHEFAYVPVEQIETIQVTANEGAVSIGPIGLGAIRFLPAQVPEHHADEIGSLLNDALERLPQSMHLAPKSSFTHAAPTSSPGTMPQLVSMYRPGRTRASPQSPSSVCTILDISELIQTKTLRDILRELKITASKLIYPAHIVEDLNETLKQGIKAAETRLIEKSVDAYRPTNVLRWIPVVGSVLNWVAPVEPENGQQFDIKRRELSSINYSYANKDKDLMAQPSLSRKGSAAGLAVNTAASSTPASATPSPLSIAAHPPSNAAIAAQQPQQQQQQQQQQASQPPSRRESGATASSGPSTAASSSAAAAPATGRPPVAPVVVQQPPSPSVQPTPTVASTPSQPQQPPQSAAAPQAQHPQQTQAAAQQPPQSTPSPSPVASPVRITLDEADSSFVDHLNAAPRSLQQSQLQLLTRGEVFLAYFPHQADETSDPHAPSTTSVTKLFLFYEPNYHATDEEAMELGVQPGIPVSLLCWCEPDQRYVKTDQAVAVEQITSLHLGVSEYFPSQSVRENCFSLITMHVALHLEAASTISRKDWFLALYTLVSQQPFTSNGSQQQQQPQQRLPSASSSGTSAPVEDEHSVAEARSTLANGMPFVVYVLDKHNIDITTRHEVVLWYRPAQPETNSPHSLCWCRRGGKLDYSPSRSLPLNKTVQICLGKQTRAFKNNAAAGSDPNATFSVMVEKMILNLEAMSSDDRGKWLEAFHKIMSATGKRRVFDADAEPSPPQAQH